ncbi:carbohydrate esterase family 6 protein [Piromyces sp. E2]|nr:carbohydrate esterase family 6 protein [Piromyces sp. E2]|eukprot:OUM64011.1 carbohydrate esterase family 6 protein [Piromyces sp. E2]
MRTSIALSFLASALTVLAKAIEKPDPNFHIYLAFGQSNMEGQAQPEVQDRIADKRFKLLSTANDCMGRELGEWYDALPPIVNCYGNLGPLDWFGRTLTKKLPEDVTVGVVPVAIAGCDIQLFEEANYKSYEQPDWMVGRVESYGGNPFRRLVEMAKEAQKSGVIKGILLHQGETNNGQLDWPDRVKAVYNDLLKELDLKAEDVPLLAGEVVSLEKKGLCGAHNEVINMLPKVIPTSYVIPASDLDQQGDDLHFNAASYRILGERYADKMLELLCADGDAAEEETETIVVEETCDEESDQDQDVDAGDVDGVEEEDSADDEE